MADPQIVEALEAFSADVDGVPFVVGRGDRFYDDDPVVRGRAQLFGPVTVRQSRARTTARSVETATAVPGERRTVAGPGPGRRPKGG